MNKIHQNEDILIKSSLISYESIIIVVKGSVVNGKFMWLVITCLVCVVLF